MKKVDFTHVVTVPTETVEGWAVALGSREGILELMRMKDRDFQDEKVFTLVPESKEAISRYAVIGVRAEDLINRYLPGELTLLLPKSPDFHHFYYDNFEKIGIRIPDHPYFKDIHEPLLLTSANPRGGVPRSETGHLPSTVVDLTGVTPVVVRQGNLVVEFM